MPTAANWTARLNELATRARVPGGRAGHLVRRTALTDSEPEDVFLRPADSSGPRFVLR